VNGKTGCFPGEVDIGGTQMPHASDENAPFSSEFSSRDATDNSGQQAKGAPATPAREIGRMARS
jgi:hypothetical protein